MQEELDKNEEYKDLLLERKEILRSNGFINKLQPRFEAICERLQEIDNETQKKLWGEVVLKDSEDEDIDFSFRDTSENVFQEALKTYCDNNKSRREYEKRMGMITDEERLRVKEFIESFNRFLIISLDVFICRYSPLFRAFPALFISEEPHKSFYYPSCFRSQK